MFPNHDAILKLKSLSNPKLFSSTWDDCIELLDRSSFFMLNLYAAIVISTQNTDEKKNF